METSDVQVCCRGLAEALVGRGAVEGDGAALRLGVGKDGALFYKLGHTAGGQFTSAFGERVAFCPFCGRGLAGGAAARAVPADEADGEVTNWRLAETQEVETVFAVRAARGMTTRIHINEF